MYKHILVPTDGSELSKQAIHAAAELAKAVGAKLTGFFATESYPVSSVAEYVPANIGSPEEFSAEQDALAKRYLAVVQTEAETAGVPCDIYFFPSTSPYKAIIQAAETRGCDLIVMASHGRRGLGAVLLGSETNKVLTHSNIPVLVHR
jgi:nucleotide-binding universal stress UspA family protein